jgi:hypothetical protein
MIRSRPRVHLPQWHDTQSFGFDDLLVVAKLMYDAHSYINAQRSRDYAASKGGKA